MEPDYYAILGLTHSATAEEIQAAYQRLTKMRGADAAVGDRLDRIRTAYEVLSDANRRTRYDLESMERELEARGRQLDTDVIGPPSAISGAGSEEDSRLSFEEELAAVLAELQRPRKAKATRSAEPAAAEEKRRSFPHRGEDREVVVEVALEEAIRGARVPVTYSVVGRRGAAAEESTHTVEVQVPKLAYHGQKLLLNGSGAPGIDGGKAGDLQVEIAYKAHRLFRLSGNDVWYYFPIAPWEAVLGAILELPTLENPHRVHVPAGTTSGQVFRLPGRGLPKAGGGRGDLLASLRIVTPQHPSEAERQLYLQLSQVSRFNPRREIS